MADTGHGATIVFSGGFTAGFTMIKQGTETRPRLSVTELATTAAQGEQYVPGDLVDHAEIDVEFHYNPNVRPPIDSAAETCTITYPVPAGSSNGATVAAPAFFTAFEPPQLKTNEIMVAKGKLSWTTRPTYANAS